MGYLCANFHACVEPGAHDCRWESVGVEWVVVLGSPMGAFMIYTATSWLQQWATSKCDMGSRPFPNLLKRDRIHFYLKDNRSKCNLKQSQNQITGSKIESPIHIQTISLNTLNGHNLLFLPLLGNDDMSYGGSKCSTEANVAPCHSHWWFELYSASVCWSKMQISNCQHVVVQMS